MMSGRTSRSRKVVGASGRGYSAEVRIAGLKETLDAIKGFEPELYKALRKQIREVLKRLASGARSRYGGNYGVSMRDAGRKPGGTVFARVGPKMLANRNDWSEPATRAVIMEFAKTGKTPQAQGMIDYFHSYFGAPGRFLWAEWDEAGDEAMAEIEQAIRDTERTLQARLDAAGVSY